VPKSGGLPATFGEATSLSGVEGLQRGFATSFEAN